LLCGELFLTVVKLLKMEDQEVEKIILNQIICRIAFNGEKHPYIAPFQYVYLNSTLYFHFTNYGRKMNLIKKDNRVCVEIEEFESDLSKYYFISLKGSLKVVNNVLERKAVMEKFFEVGKNRLSTNFLEAHGFSKELDWSVFSQEKQLLFLKLDDIKERIGLKSS
jgi:nitroimidazol reductase NimA-like FMN-containing flavoprotein (pyridoxamine 5'-phosphate oxidase superfamily)